MKQPNKKKYLTKSNEKLDHKRSKNQVLNMQEFLLKQRVEQDKKLSMLLQALYNLVIQKDHKEKHGTYKDDFDKKGAWEFARKSLKPCGYKKDTRIVKIEKDHNKNLDLLKNMVKK